MKTFRFTLQAKVLLGIVLTLGMLILLVFKVWQQQQHSQAEIVETTRRSTHTLLSEQMRLNGESQVQQLAEALVNPLYFFDLEEIGSLARNTLRISGVDYVLVYDTEGRILHDGSGDIASFGMRMDDALADAVISADSLHTESSSSLLDVSAPILIGDERLGGVRIGYTTALMQRAEQDALDALEARFSEINQRSETWFWWGAVGLVLIMLLAVASLQKLLVRPIKMLGDAARQIEAGNFSSPVPDSDRRDELGDLIRTFGRMRESVAKYDRDIRRVAYSDPLTGLPNRLAFREELERRLRESQGNGRSMALLFIDLDGFKRVNDSLGHEAGDDVLQQIADRIEREVRALGGNASIPARLGGDEFVALIQGDETDTSKELRQRASLLAGRLVKTLASPMALQGRQVQLGGSLGIAVYPDDADTASRLMKHGDIAMYQAKLAGKNCYRFYNPGMDQAMEKRARMEGDLRGAWERGEMYLVYQPIYRMQDRVLMGAEALLRWDHPMDGHVAPPIFIDVAEQSDLIEKIGLASLRHACLEAASWEIPPGGDTLPFISVNVSARQLQHGDLYQHVQDALLQSGLAAERLHLELTETAVISNEENATALLEKLNALGVKVWLDDFGTGYSSLSHLRRVQVDGLKIDRSFVTDILTDPEDRALATAIVAMAHSMGITVVAEGVEEQGQFDFLRDQKCDFVQGFWLAYPMDAKAFSALLQ